MGTVEQNIIDFLNYTEDADGMENEIFWEMKARARKVIKEFHKKKIYLEAFKKQLYEEKSILNHAIMKGLDLLPRLLMDELDVDPSSAQYDHVGRTSMHYVCQGGNMVFLNEFIIDKRYKIEYNARDNTGLIPLHLAILHGHTKVTDEMLKGVGVVENRDLFFGRSIHAAAYMDQISVVQKIFERFPEEVSIVVSGFCTPHVCALYGDSFQCLVYLWLASPVMRDKILSKLLYTQNLRELP